MELALRLCELRLEDLYAQRLLARAALRQAHRVRERVALLLQPLLAWRFARRRHPVASR